MNKRKKNKKENKTIAVIMPEYPNKSFAVWSSKKLGSVESVFYLKTLIFPFS